MIKVYGPNWDLMPRRRSQSTSTTPTPAWPYPELMRILIDEKGLDWDRAERHCARRMRLYQPHHAFRGAWSAGRRIWSSMLLPRIYIDTGRDEPPPVRPPVEGIHRPVEPHRQHGDNRLRQCADGQSVRRDVAITSTAYPRFTPTYCKSTTFYGLL